MVDLLALQTFVRIADSGSLSAAARATGRSLPAVSRSLVQLEADLGVRLLHRTTRRIHLTDAGAQYLERCRRILAEVDEANASVSDLGRALAGPITLTAPILFGQLHMAPVVTEFLGLHPGVSVNLMLSDRYSNIVEEGIDLAVRIGKLHGFRAGRAQAGRGAPRRVRVARLPQAPRDAENAQGPREPQLPAVRRAVADALLGIRRGGKPRQVRVQGNFSSRRMARR